MTIVERSSILSFALKSMSYKEIEQVGGVFERKAQPLRTAPPLNFYARQFFRKYRHSRNNRDLIPEKVGN